MKLEIFITISILLNLFLFMGQLGLDNVAQEQGIDSFTIYRYTGSHISQFNKGNQTNFQLDTNISLPGGSAQVSDDSGNFFADVFKIVRNWLLDLPGVKFVTGPLNALPNFLKLVLPQELAFVLGYAWHALVVFALVAWATGKN